MLYDSKGRIIPSNGVRRGMQFDARSLPKDAMISMEWSRDFQRKLRNDPILRERLETLARMSGRRSVHLEMLSRGKDRVSKADMKKMEINQKFGEKVLNENN